MKIFLQILVLFLGSVNLLMARFAQFRLRQPATLPAWALKVAISALSPVLFIAGCMVVIAGSLLNSWPIVIIGIAGALFYLIHIIKITEAPDPMSSLDKIFGSNYKSLISKEKKSFLLPNRYVLLLRRSPKPILQQNIAYYSIPDTERQLLCDIWRPPKNIKQSGLAFIYLHGSAWAVLDKDIGTRPFFRHLASQGHVIMDVAYRLFPETNLMGMVHDALHAVAWLKAHAGIYGINPDKIVIGGGSAGAHIALLVAYSGQSKRLMPANLKQGVDISVCGVISLYGQSDLIATYYHTHQHMTARSALGKKKNNKNNGMPTWTQKRMGEDFHRLGFDKDVQPGMLAPMLGGSPAEMPEAYAMFSPVTYVHSQCPATLIIHGEHDILAPVKAIRDLYLRLTDAGVPAAMHLIPQTDHAFDLILPEVSPSAHNAIFDIDHFLALMAASATSRQAVNTNYSNSAPYNENIGILSG